ncbi:MAG TPA: ABC transporter permease [Candidatus Sphingobacterium stercoripullorum]|uniref:ABC transporter permease n=1 Tax=Candidatus Sphingobacterium stercoripullorum TaxID=2838759 RepID=A0A9D1W7E1_9SPHI|nr:ABC transporter permease [Candidatus Sphingobacterium stercoripullorum]
MNKTLIIIKREYLSRVKKKSFLLVTFLMPILFIGLYAAIIVLTMKSFENTHATVYVYDHGQDGVDELLENSKNLTFIKGEDDLAGRLAKLHSSKDNTGVLIISDDFYNSKSVEYISSNKPNVTIQSEIKKNLRKIVREKQYADLDIDLEKIQQVDDQVYLSAKEINLEGEAQDSHTNVAMFLAMGLSALVYIALMLYGTQVLRGVIEEKTNRIVEVIISSVKPFELMMGKIVGIALVGLTQFLLWIVLSIGLFTVGTTLFLNPESFQSLETAQMSSSMDSQMDTLPENIQEIIQAIDFPMILGSFALFFIGGYLLYSALFAAIGSAVDNETEANQFTLPVTMPLLLAYVLSFGVLVNDPHGPIAVWLSMIPLTSPIAMMVRIAFGVPIWEIAVSLTLLILGFILTTWIAGKIYRVGILMYGKKASFKEIFKWLKYNK